MPNHPLITVVTVTFNAELVIGDTINSLVSQKSQNFEWVVIDGISTDRTLDIISGLYSISFPNIVISEFDRGLYDAMNKGISLSSGHYIIFMNAGDVFFDDSVLSDFENFIESCTSFPAMVYGHTHVKLSDGSFFKRKVRSLDYIWHGQPTIHQSVFFNREVHSQNLYAFEKYPVSSDYAVMASIQRANGDNIKVWDRTVSVFDNDPGSFGNRQLLQRVRDAWNVQRDINRSPILARIVSVGKRLAANVFYNFRRNAR